ncbi:DUF302 domain-containing protein [Moraxella oculi]|uniref:DUF302 domain-containing protein n=1 Tax=Moraxella oculi TaxID=2940516 RepID=A0ABW8U6R6_9GAMM
MKYNYLFAIMSIFTLTACAHQPHQNSTMVSSQSIAQPVVVLNSTYDFATTKSKILNALKQKNMTIFAEIDHQAAASEVGLTMQPSTVIVFGTPKVGTPYMVKDPIFALQLPLKVLVTEVDGGVQVVMNRTEALVHGSRISNDEVKDTLGKARFLIENAIK